MPFCLVGGLTIPTSAEVQSRSDIVGFWKYPTPGVDILSYRTTFEIRRDGTFTKEQGWNSGSTTYEGEYTWGDGGTVTFRVLSGTYYNYADSISFDPAIPSKGPTTNEYDVSIRCRCSVDGSGYLLIEDYGKAQLMQGTGIVFETYMPCDTR